MATEPEFEEGESVWITTGQYRGRVVSIKVSDGKMCEIWLGPKKTAWILKRALKPIEQHGKREFKAGRSYE